MAKKILKEIKKLNDGVKYNNIEKPINDISSKSLKETENLNDGVKYNGIGKLINDISSKSLNENIEPETYICEYCGKEYKTKNGLKNHLKKCKIQLKDTTYNAENVVKETLKNTQKFKITKEISTKDISTKEMYETMINQGSFILKINSVEIFDSDNDDIMNLSFTNEHFRIGKKMFPYLGLNFKYKK
jgi:hypothetical protein